MLAVYQKDFLRAAARMPLALNVMILNMFSNPGMRGARSISRGVIADVVGDKVR